MRATVPVCTRGNLGPDGEDKAQDQSRGGMSLREEGPWDSIMQTLVFNFQTPWAPVGGLGPVWHLVPNRNSKYVAHVEWGSN